MVVAEPGLVVTESTHSAICKVEGQSVIKWIVPDRSVAKKGDLVCQLDSDELKKQLADQTDAANKAGRAVQAAREAIEVAECAVSEHAVASDDAERAFLKTLQAHLERKRAEFAATKATWDLARKLEEKFRRQINDCDFHAPTDGLVLHANDTRFINNRINIASGATVRKRQIIFKMPSVRSGLRVATHVPEWSINHLAIGSRAQVTIDGVPGRVFPGKISEIAALRDPVSLFDSRGSVYSLWIRAQEPPPEFVFEANVHVEIDVADLKDVLLVRADAVVRFQGKDHVAVKKAGGGFDWLVVDVGLTDGISVEVKQGVLIGEQVILDAARLVGAAGKKVRTGTPGASE